MEKMQNRSTAREKLDMPLLIRAALSKLKFIAAGALSAACTLPFGALPFGFALIAAANRNAVFVYIGAIFGALSAYGAGEVKAILYIGILTAELLLRVLVRMTVDSPFSTRDKQPLSRVVGVLFGESMTWRIISGTLAVFAFYLSLTLGGGLLAYDFFALLLSVILTPIAVYLFGGIFGKSGLWQDIGTLSLFAVLSYACASFKIYGVSVCVAAGMLLVFYITQKRGLLLGLLSSLAWGAAYSPVMIPVFAFCALGIGIFGKLSVGLSCFAALFTASSWSVYIDGIRTLNGVFGGIISACLLFPALSKFAEEAKKIRHGKTASKETQSTKETVCSVLPTSELDSIRLQSINRHMSVINDSISELSALFQALQHTAADSEVLYSICKNAFDSSCDGCSAHEECINQNIIPNSINRLLPILEEGRLPTYADTPDELFGRCGRLSDILDEIGYNSGIGSAPSAMGIELDIKELSALLARGLEAEESEYSCDRALSGSVCEALNSTKLGIAGALVWGKRYKKVYIRALEYNTLLQNRDLILSVLQSALPFKLDTQTAEIHKNDAGGVLTVSAAPAITLKTASKQHRAKQEPMFCGDGMTSFVNKDGRFFSLISDGMGNGKDAAAVSEICVKFTENMLASGQMNEELLSLLNSILISRTRKSADECSATFDLLECDIMQGKASFFKSGAAPSYLFRDGSLLKLCCANMPIGILKETECKKIRFDLSAGDAVIMMSDGVCDGKDDCPWLYDLLRRNIELSDPERTADLILKYAFAHGSRDDISVCVIKVN